MSTKRKVTTKKNLGIDGSVNAQSLKNLFWQTMISLRNKEIDPRVANSIALQGRGIMSVIKAEIEVAKMSQASKEDTSRLLK